MFYDRNYLYTKLADKYAVRDFIRQTIGDQYLVPLKHVFDSPDELLTMESWAGSVIKGTHASGMVEFVKFEPDEVEKLRIVSECKKWMKTDYSESSQEYCYKKIPRKIIVEEFLDVGGKTPNDYKFHCFPQGDGEMHTVLQVVNDRYGTQSRGYYLDGLEDCVWHHGEGKHQIPDEDKSSLLVAIDLCRRICYYFNYLRVDWYVVGGRLYIGELTFTPGAGVLNEFGEELEKKMFEFWVL